MGTESKDEYAYYILDSDGIVRQDGTWTKLGEEMPDIRDTDEIRIDNDAAFEEQAKAHRVEANEELTCDTVLPGCMALEPEEIQSAVVQGLQDGLTMPIEIKDLELESCPKLTYVNIPYRWLPKRGRCGNRKRYVKLLMSLGVPRNFANHAAETMRKNHISYRQNWEQYYTINELFGLRPSGVRGRGIYDRENDQWELFPAYSD